METKTISRDEEKMKLAEELDLTGYIRGRNQKKKLEELDNKLSTMNFKKTNREEIKRKICKVKWHGWVSPDGEVYGHTLVLECCIFFGLLGFIAVSIIAMFKGLKVFSITEPIAIIILPIILGSILAGFKRCKLSSISLDEWTDDLPYGALLAVKEAKEKSIRNFKIFYPTYQKSAVRYITDPIIVGTYSYGFDESIYLEIFAWDDSKVYE